MSEKDSTPAPKAQSTVRLALWLTFLAFLLIIAVFHSKISEIHFDSQGVSAKMSNTEEVNKLSPEDRKAASDDLTQRISALEKDAKSHVETAKPAAAPEQPATAPVTEATYQQHAPVQQTSLPNITGTWGSPIGLAYVVQQYGNYVLITEVNQGVVEAAAGGTISGWSFSLQSQNILNHPGVLTLTVSADQRHMAGQYLDNVTGQVSAMYLNR